jgi:hypothetical protein
MAKQSNSIILILAIVLSSLLTGCKESRIPDSDMVTIFVEVFITDALVTTTKLSIKYSKRDSIEYYKPIYSKLGYSDEEFISTIDYYMDNQDVLDKVLDKVVNELVILETERNAKKIRAKEEKEEEELNNLWKRKKEWILPKDGKKESLAFMIPIKGVGVYSISANVKVMPDDESINPEMTVWFYSDDSTEVGFRLNVKSTQYLKDSISREIKITNILTDSTATHIMGYFMNHQPQDGDWQKSAEISNISIRVFPLPSLINYNQGFMKTIKLDAFTMESLKPNAVSIETVKTEAVRTGTLKPDVIRMDTMKLNFKKVDTIGHLRRRLQKAN